MTADDWGPRSRTYTAKVPRADLAPGWRVVTLPPSRFVDAQGRPPDRWAVLDKLEITGKASRRDPPRFGRLRWTPATIPKTGAED